MPRASIVASPRLLLPLAALLVVLPLLLHGNSCGQDLTFHLQSWLDAAQQLRHGHYPRWDATAAWNAGEPRFLFYPPLSWLLGAALTLILPIILPGNTAFNAAPTVFIFIAVLASGLSFHKLARSILGTHSSPYAALIASALYLANPYMLFNAFERSALAELLAAAWIPLLLLAVLRPRPTPGSPAGLPAGVVSVRGVAIPLALLWLTNVPAAVMGSYLLALLIILRIVHLHYTNRSVGTLTFNSVAGALLGLALPAFYLIPAATERPLIQSTMALIPPLRYRDNFLFTHTADTAHNAVNRTISFLALTLLLLTVAAQAAVFLRRAAHAPEIAVLDPELPSRRSQTSVLLSEGEVPHPAPESTDSEAILPSAEARTFVTSSSTDSLDALPEENPHPDRAPLGLAAILAVVSLLIGFLLTPLSTPVWRYLPELGFLQFPWRLLTLLTPVLALAIALLLDQCFVSTAKTTGAPFLAQRFRAAGAAAPLITLALPLILSLAAYRLYSQRCDPTETPATLAHTLATHHGTLPTDEYTPAIADNDLLRTDDPPSWLVPLNDPNAPAPNTHPTATELNPSIDTDDTPILPSQTLSTPAPHRLALNLFHPAILVLNLRAYPNWRVTLTHPNQRPSPSAQNSAQHPTPAVRAGPAQDLERNDGLIAIALPSGTSSVSVAWRETPDQTLGLAISALALLLLGLNLRNRNNKLSPSAQDRRT